MPCRLVEGFSKVLEKLNDNRSYQFCVPGPADYPGGIIIDDLPNFPAFKGKRVAIGPFLHECLVYPFHK